MGAYDRLPRDQDAGKETEGGAAVRTPSSTGGSLSSDLHPPGPPMTLPLSGTSGSDAPTLLPPSRVSPSDSPTLVASSSPPPT